MHTIFLFAVLSASPALANTGSTQVKFLNGQTAVGKVVSISADSVAVETAKGTEEFDLSDVLQLDTGQSPEAATQQQELRLRDGGLVPCDSIERDARMLTAKTVGLGEVSIPASLVAAVRLQPMQDSFAGQWKTFLSRTGNKDLLVVPKRDGSGLDFLAGIVSSIGPSEISFLLDGDTIPVPAERVFGVVFATADSEQPAGLASITTTYGEKFVAAGMVLRDGRLTTTTAWEQQVSIEWSRIIQIDLSRGRIHYLSDLDPISENFSGLDPEGDIFAGLVAPEIASQLYGPARDRTIESGSPLRLRGVTYPRGLCIHSRTELVYALDRKYKSFEAIAGVDDEVAFNLDRKVLLVVSGDGQELLRHTFGTQDDPKPISLPVTGIRTLTILVDFADGNSQCDWLDLADAKLILASDE
jgi:hypothetical protein